jgi:UDP-2,3-diacylglucosamine pyrophosphatase LpxH
MSHRPIRSIFVSDVHLGSRYSHAESFLDFLRSHEPEHLYLVGDIIDGWELRRRWFWPQVYDRILKRLLELKAAGTRIYYTPGNHDDFLRSFLLNLGIVDIADEFIHEAPDGSRYLVTHGDKFDAVELTARWLSQLGSIGYDFLLMLDWVAKSVCRRLKLRTFSLSSYIKRKVKQAVKYISDYEDVVAEYARFHRCVGVICGHIHAPVIRPTCGIQYCNSGDWIENCSALIEYADGEMKIHRHSPDAKASARATQSVDPLLSFRRSAKPVLAARAEFAGVIAEWSPPESDSEHESPWWELEVDESSTFAISHK